MQEYDYYIANPTIRAMSISIPKTDNNGTKRISPHRKHNIHANPCCNCCI